MGLRADRLPRYLHPGAWWVWALGLAGAAGQTTNPLLLAILIGVAGLVVMARRSDAPYARSFRAFLLLGVVVLTLRMLVQVVFGTPVPGGTVLFTLPEVSLPDWAAGVRIGGDVTVEGLVLSFYQGLQLVAVLAAVGAANALADARRLLRAVPGAVYEAGVALVVALTFAPRLISDAVRVRRTLRLRGVEVGTVRGVGRVAVPVLENALDGSLELAAAMDSRGFGRRASVSPRWRITSTVLVLGGLLGVLAGVYGLLAGASTPVTGSGVLVLGVVLALVGMTLAGRGSVRTRYRPDPWNSVEWLVSASGLTAAATFAWAAASGLPGMNMMVVPLTPPEVPVLALLGAVVAVLPAWLAPVPPSWSAAAQNDRAQHKQPAASVRGGGQQ